jgi:dienelactone hydrolase
LLLLACVILTGRQPLAAADSVGDLVAQLRKVEADFLETDHSGMLSADARARIRAANQRENKLWSAIATKADWEKYRHLRLAALRESLGRFPEPPRDLKVQVVRALDGDGYRIENMVFESRPGLVVTANLYSPSRAGTAMPGILICPSHHNPRTQGELQDMGMSWARLGCIVLVMDNLGHGERRQHPFVDAGSYPEKFRVGRQDYYFRYNTALQLCVVGESLIGWMVWDLMRGIDLLLGRPGIDKERILLLGSVAGGGDPAAVAAALDPRITAVAPFNFGGPQPETDYPLPAGADTAFNYAGLGSWESTRNLRLSARDGFFPWVIVAAAAPRRLLYAHEFSWDRDHDPVWKRLEKIYALYEAPGNLASMHGRGRVTGKPPEATHCNNIGPEHRQAMYPALNKWFDLRASPEKEHRVRHKVEDLLCSTASAGPKLRPMYDLAAELGAERAATARARLGALPPARRLPQMQRDWAALLGDVEPREAPKRSLFLPGKVADVTIERFALEVEPGIVLPALLLLPPHKAGARAPVVVTFAQEGKRELLRQHGEGIAALVEGGAAVCLPDLRGTGETRPGASRGRTSTATTISSTELMLGQTLVGSRLRDLRSVLRYLRNRSDLDAGRIALWGDSLAPANAEGQRLDVPLDADKFPNQAEPLGGLLALFGALYEPEIKAIYAQGGLFSYQELLHSYFCYLPHDAVVPGALTAGDLTDVAAMLAPRPLRLEGLVDGRNRKVGNEALRSSLESAHIAYRGARDRLIVQREVARSDLVAAWLLAQLNTK